MKLTVEQFVETFNRLIQSVAWKFSRQYKLSPYDHDDLRSELMVRAVAWYERFPDVIERSVDESEVGALLKNHLNHRTFSWIKNTTKHWGVLSLDCERQLGEGPSAHHSWDVENPQAERDVRNGDNLWVYRVLDMLPKSDQLILCKRYGLRGHHPHLVSELDMGEDAVAKAVQKLRRAEKALRAGRPIRFREYKRRKLSLARIEKRRKIQERIVAYLRKHGTTATTDLAIGIDEKREILYHHLDELVRRGVIRTVGFKKRKGYGPNTRLFELVESL